MEPHNTNEQSCFAESIITLANQWISSKINILVIEDREFQFLAAKTPVIRVDIASKVLVAIKQARGSP